MDNVSYSILIPRIVVFLEDDQRTFIIGKKLLTSIIARAKKAIKDVENRITFKRARATFNDLVKKYVADYNKLKKETIENVSNYTLEHMNESNSNIHISNVYLYDKIDESDFTLIYTCDRTE